MIELLESRFLLAVALADRIVTVTGTKNAPDKPHGDGVRIFLKRHIYSVYLNDTVTLFRSGVVSGFVIDTAGGNDQVVCDSMSLPMTLLGGNGNDVLTGGSGGNVIQGGDGNDFLAGGAGDDSLDGGEGTDAADYSLRSDPLVISLQGEPSGGAGEDDRLSGIEEAIGGAAGDLLIAGNFSSYLGGGAGNDTLLGGPKDDVLIGGSGTDFMLGNQGSDFILARDNELDYLLGGRGLDIAQIDPIDTSALGSPFDNEPGSRLDPLPPASIPSSAPHAIAAAAAEDLVITGDLNSSGQPIADSIRVVQTGNQIDIFQNGRHSTADATTVARLVIDAGGGNDTILLQNLDGTQGVMLPALINGSDGADTIVGGNAADTISGDAWNDSINGGLKNDDLRGGMGNDTLLGGRGYDILNGGLDTFSGVPDGADYLDGGRDNDAVDYSLRIDPLHLWLDDLANDGAAGENDQILNVTDVLSGNGSDSIIGNNEANLLSGSGGQDTIQGLGGNDSFFPSRQTDTVIGGDGTDFVFAADGKRDEITPGSEGNKFTRGDKVDIFHS